MSSSHLVYCHCAYANVVPKDVKAEVLRGLIEADQSFFSVADLCKMSSEKDPQLKKLTSKGPMKIIACYPRAVHWLLKKAEANVGDDLEIMNMRTQKASEILEVSLSP